MGLTFVVTIPGQPAIMIYDVRVEDTVNTLLLRLASVHSCECTDMRVTVRAPPSAPLQSPAPTTAPTAIAIGPDMTFQSVLTAAGVRSAGTVSGQLRHAGRDVPLRIMYSPGAVGAPAPAPAGEPTRAPADAPASAPAPSPTASPQPSAPPFVARASATATASAGLPPVARMVVSQLAKPTACGTGDAAVLSRIADYTGVSTLSLTCKSLYDMARASLLPGSAAPSSDHALAHMFLYAGSGAPLPEDGTLVRNVAAVQLNAGGYVDIYAIRMSAPVSLTPVELRASSATEGDATISLQVRGNGNCGKPTGVDVRVNMRDATVNTLRQKVATVTGIPVAQQAVHLQGAQLLYPQTLLSALSSFTADGTGAASTTYAAASMAAAGLTIERMPAPDATGPVGIQRNFFAAQLNSRLLPQSQAGRAALFASLYALAQHHGIRQQSADHCKRIAATFTTASTFPPLGHAIDSMLCNETLGPSARAAIVEGCTSLFRRVLPSVGAPMGVNTGDFRIWELAHVAIAYIVTCALAGSAGTTAAEADDTCDGPTTLDDMHTEAQRDAGQNPSEPSTESGVAVPATWEAALLALQSRPEFQYTDMGALRSSTSTRARLVVDAQGCGYPAIVVDRPKDNSASVQLFDPILGQEHRRDIDEMIQAASGPDRGHLFKYVAPGAMALPRPGVPVIVEDFLRPPKEAVVVLLDTSQSMNEVAFPGSTDLGASMPRIEAVSHMFHAFANRSAAYDLPHLVSLIAFGLNVQTVCRWTESWTEFARSLQGVQAAGRTFMWDAAYLAQQRLVELKRRYELADCRLRVLVLTDGHDDGSEKSALDVCRALQEANITMDAVVVGDDADSRLKPMCVATGGGFFRPTDFRSALQVFEDETFLSVRQRASCEPKPRVEDDAALDVYANNRKFRISQLGDKTFRRPLPSACEAKAHKPLTALAAVEDSEDARAVAEPAPGGAPAHPAASESSLTAAQRRMRRVITELRRIVGSPINDFEVFPSSTDIFTWRVLLRGPAGSPYQGGVFELVSVFPERYPAVAPDIRFVTRIVHCNINTTGRICHRVFDRNYEARFSFAELIMNIVGLLMTPEPSDPLDSVLADLYRSDRVEYVRAVESAVRVYATETYEEAKRRLLGEEAPRMPAEECDEDGVPYRFICPITTDMFVDPVITPENFTYERLPLQEHLARNPTDPQSRRPLRMEDVRANDALRNEVEAFRAQLARGGRRRGAAARRAV